MKVNEISKGTLVTGVIGDDIHNIGLKVLEHALRDVGFEVVSLGVRVSQEDFINAAIGKKADAILVSSLSGHARALAPGLRDKCMEFGLTNILLYIGGQLTIGETTWQETQETFTKMGFDRVYPSSVLTRTVVMDLEADLRHVKGS